jgi:hypothetical protein
MGYQILREDEERILIELTISKNSNFLAVHEHGEEPVAELGEVLGLKRTTISKTPPVRRPPRVS